MFTFAIRLYIIYTKYLIKFRFSYQSGETDKPHLYNKHHISNLNNYAIHSRELTINQNPRNH